MQAEYRSSRQLKVEGCGIPRNIPWYGTRHKTRVPAAAPANRGSGDDAEHAGSASLRVSQTYTVGTSHDRSLQNWLKTENCKAEISFLLGRPQPT
jgi:hypothetical protein